MDSVLDLVGYEPPVGGTVVTIGAYDGVHLGHQAVLRLVRDLATARNCEAVCLTFDRHPAEVVRTATAPKLLTNLEQKLELLAQTGFVDTTCVLTFDEERSKEAAEDFVRTVLVEGLGARLVVVGADFHFGHRRHGKVELLEQMGAELGFEVIGLGLVPVAGDSTGVAYSSTRIRELLGEGNVTGAARLLGLPARDYEVRGTVVKGDQRGRELGYPTANVAVSDRMCLPADGIYAGYFRCGPSSGAPLDDGDGIERPCAVSLGRRPTFYEDAPVSLLEAFLLDFDDDLYGRNVAVRFVDRIRGEERFESRESLIKQMGLDVEETRRLLGP